MNIKEPKSIVELVTYGISAVKCKKGKGSVQSGIKKIKSYKVHVDRSCINTINEFASLCYAIDSAGNTQEDKFTLDPHILDAVRYALSYVYRQGDKNYESISYLQNFR